MLATTWDKIRDEKSRLYGKHSFLYRSIDGGRTWTNIHHPPLPQSVDVVGQPVTATYVGRMGVDFSDSDPNRAYLISSTAGGNFNGFFRSTDAGATWTAVGPDRRAARAAEHQRRVRLVVRPRLRRPGRTRSTCSSRASTSPRASTAASPGRRRRPARRPARPRVGSVHTGQGVPRQRRRLLLVERERPRARPLGQDPAPARDAVLRDGRLRPGRLARQRRLPGQRLAEVVGSRQHRHRRLVQLPRRRRDDEPHRPDERPEVLRLLPERWLPRLRRHAGRST